MSRLPRLASAALVIAASAVVSSSSGADDIAQAALETFEARRAVYSLDRYRDDPDGAAVGWGAGTALKAYLAAYEGTGDPLYFSKIPFNADPVFANRSDRIGRPDALRDRVMPAWVTGKYTAGADHAWLVHAGNFLFPVTRWAYLVKQEPELNRIYGEKADAYLAEAAEILAAFEALDWREGPGAGEGRFVGNPNASGGDLPHNMMHAAGRVYIHLWLATGEERFREKAEKMASFWKNRLVLRGDRYEWKYATYHPRLEDVSHGSMSVDFAVHAHRAGIVFDEIDLARFSATLTHITVRGTASSPYTELVDSFESYPAGSLAGRGSWLVTVPAQANIIGNIDESPDGSKYVRITVDKVAGQGTVRVRNPVVRPFSPDGIARWSMKNNSLAHLGDFNIRLSINGGTHNLFNFRLRGQLNGQFQEGSLTNAPGGGAPSQTWTDRFLPRDIWTDWTVEFFSADPSNRYLNLYVTRSDDSSPVFELVSVPLPDVTVESIYAFDMTVPDPVENLDFSVDNFRTFAALPEDDRERVIGYRWFVDGSGSLERSYLAHRWLRLGWSQPDLPQIYFEYFDAVKNTEPALQMLQAAAYLMETGKPWTMDQPIPPAGSFDAWLYRHFTAAERANGDISGPAADPFGDGMTNLLRYAVGLGPAEAGHHRRPGIRLEEEAGGLLVRLQRDVTASEAIRFLESSDDLMNWSAADSHLELIGSSREGDIETEVYRAVNAAESKRFYRVRVQL
jgi:hypothetical protein